MARKDPEDGRSSNQRRLEVCNAKNKHSTTTKTKHDPNYPRFAVCMGKGVKSRKNPCIFTGVGMKICHLAEQTPPNPIPHASAECECGFPCNWAYRYATNEYASNRHLGAANRTPNPLQVHCTAIAPTGVQVQGHECSACLEMCNVLIGRSRSSS